MGLEILVGWRVRGGLEILVGFRVLGFRVVESLVGFRV